VDPTAQRELGRAELHVRSAEALLFTAVDDMWRTVKARRRPTLEPRAQLRMGCVNAGATQHGALAPPREVVGRVLLGLNPQGLL
jgi:hypothetical protein